MYTLSALWTAAHHGIAVVWVICNNGSYESLKSNLVEHLGGVPPAPFLAMDLHDPELRFDRLAEAHGVRGWRVERAEEFGPALADALGSGGPALLDVAIASAFSRTA